MELGFGASGPWGAKWFSEAKALAVLKTALEGGIRHFDTAPFYMNGRAERRLGNGLTQIGSNLELCPGDLTISTKIGKQVGRNGRLVRDFRDETFRANLALSRQSLSVETLDIVYLHGPDKHELASSLPFLLAEKAAGRLSRIGVCSDGPALLQAARHPDIDVIMGRFSLFDRLNETAFEVAKEADKLAVTVSPLGQALWRKDWYPPRRLSHFWYAARAYVRSRDQHRSTQNILEDLSFSGWSPVELSYAFLRQHPLVDVAITTTTQPTHLAESLAAIKKPVSEELHDRLQKMIRSD